MKDKQHNVLIIGAGLAGLYAALSLAPRPVTILSPKPLGFDASSAWAQGGVAAAMDEHDTPEAHANDTVIAGDGIVDADIADADCIDVGEDGENCPIITNPGS